MMIDYGMKMNRWYILILYSCIEALNAEGNCISCRRYGVYPGWEKWKIY
jgi:hypothetical protein